jgi:hypothetical protein
LAFLGGFTSAAFVGSVSPNWFLKTEEAATLSLGLQCLGETGFCLVLVSVTVNKNDLGGSG